MDRFYFMILDQCLAVEMKAKKSQYLISVQKQKLQALCFTTKTRSGLFAYIPRSAK